MSLSGHALGRVEGSVESPSLRSSASASTEQRKADRRFLSEPASVPPPFNVTTVYFVGPAGLLIRLTQKNQT
jgi:hypothetical protein